MGADVPIHRAAEASSAHKYSVIAAFSVAHEVPGVLLTMLMPIVFVRQLGLPVEYLGLFGIPLVVTGFKWLWAPLVDRIGSRRMGRRMSWIVPSTALVSALYIVIGSITPTLGSFAVILGLFIAVKIVFSTYEIAADAYVVENLADTERGVGAGVVWFGKEMGQVIGLAGLMIVADRFGWAPAFYAAAALFAAINLIGLTRREAPLRAPRPGHSAKIWTYLREPVNRHIVLLTFFFAFAVQIPSAVIGVFLNSKGFSLSEIGIAIGVAASLGAAISIALGSLTIRVLGVKHTAWITLGLGVFALPPFLWLSVQITTSLPVLMGIIFWGALMTAPIRMTFYAARLQWTGPNQAGTDFTLQQSAWFLGYGGSLLVGGLVAGSIGWVGVFILNGVLVTAVILAFIGLYDRFERLTLALHRTAMADTA
ncbi:MAG: MFS transporter [Pseudomonadota bacterium]